MQVEWSGTCVHYCKCSCRRRKQRAAAVPFARRRLPGERCEARTWGNERLRSWHGGLLYSSMLVARFFLVAYIRIKGVLVLSIIRRPLVLQMYMYTVYVLSTSKMPVVRRRDVCHWRLRRLHSWLPSRSNSRPGGCVSGIVQADNGCRGRGFFFSSSVFIHHTIAPTAATRRLISAHSIAITPSGLAIP